MCVLSVEDFKPVFPTKEDQRRFYEKLAEQVRPVLDAQRLATIRSEHQSRSHLVM